jgi:catechol 2,3-dioxygenase-like lactoylglutathione lyase family enzyme
MLSTSPMYTSVAVPNLERAKAFYGDILGLDMAIDATPNMVMFSAGDGTRVMVYPKPDHRPADFTVLNFAVADIDLIVEGLTGRGVVFEKNDDTDERGVATRGPVDVAWTRDPAGNWIGLSQGL